MLPSITSQFFKHEIHDKISWINSLFRSQIASDSPLHVPSLTWRVWLQLSLPFKRVNKLQIVLRFRPIFNSVLLRQCPTRESLLLYCDTLIIASINFAPARRIFNHNMELELREVYFAFLALSWRCFAGIVSAVFIFMLNQPHLSLSSRLNWNLCFELSSAFRRYKLRQKMANQTAGCKSHPRKRGERNNNSGNVKMVWNLWSETGLVKRRVGGPKSIPT